MKSQDLRTKSEQELRDLETQLRDDLFRLKLKHFTGQLQRTSELKETRRNIARVKTILNEKGA